ncbi:MAG TPA: DUF3352 domain-containing protein, partial [Candidatus Caenarcaniphilales bacterium]
MLKRPSFFFLLITSVLALLLIGGSGWFWLAAHSPLKLLSGKQSVPAAAMFVPRQAPVMGSLLVNPDRLVALRQAIGSPQARQRSRAELNQLKQKLLLRTGLDYQRDIQSWLGEELTFAITSLDIDRQRQGLQPGYLLVLQSRDAARSRQCLELFWQRQTLVDA